MAETETVIVKSDKKVMQAEQSPNSFFILVTSLAALAVAALVLFWYFGVFDNLFGLTPAKPAAR